MQTQAQEAVLLPPTPVATTPPKFTFRPALQSVSEAVAVIETGNAGVKDQIREL
jgi:hypothetical protein